MKRFLGVLFTLMLVISLVAIGLPLPVLAQPAKVWADVGCTFAMIQDNTLHAHVQRAYGKLPLSFETNIGQTDVQVKFLSRGNGYTLFLTLREAVLALRKPVVSTTPSDDDTPGIEYATLRMQLIGANLSPQVTGLDELFGKSNYLTGKDPQKWHTDVPNFAKVQYKDVYPGVDLVYYGNQRQLEYDFVVAPGADPEAIQLGFDGAHELTLDDWGNLILHMAGGDIILNAPVIYQVNDGVKQAIPGRYVLQDRDQVGFQLGAYDTGRLLIIDPVLVYSTYLGGSFQDCPLGLYIRGSSVAVDASGSAYVTGWTLSTDFPTASPIQVDYGGDGDAFVTKLNAAGSALVYSTYLGGSGDDRGYGITVDSAGNAYVTGETRSTDFPTASPLQTAHAGGLRDAFVTKLNATGSTLDYSTYLGGSGSDQAWSITVDSPSSVYVTGTTSSTDFPTTGGAVQPTFGGGGFWPTDTFVTKLNATGSTLDYSTYLGGSGDEQGCGIAVDSSGSAYVTGSTSSTDFPTESPFQATNSGNDDAFVTKLNATGSTLDYSTYLGGSGSDRAWSIAADSSGSAYVTGSTSSTDFPTESPFQATNSGNDDAFVTKLNATGSTLDYSTYLGGSNQDIGYGIAADPSGTAYITGCTYSTGFPTANPVQIANAGGYDAFVTKLNVAGSALVYSTYLGGSAEDMGHGIAVDSSGSAYVTGYTYSSDFPTESPVQGDYGGNNDYFVAKIGEPPTALEATVDFNPDTLNKKSKGKWVSAYIELEAGYDVNDIDVNTVTLNDTIPAETKPTGIDDYDTDGVPDLMVKFDRAELISYLQGEGIEDGNNVELTVTGEVAGIPFEDTDTIRVIE